MENLPQELIHEILLYLPAKSLLRFKCVSKSLSATINSQNFINSHMKSWSKNRINRSLIYLSRCSDDSSIGKVHSFDIDRGSRMFLEEEFPLEIKPPLFVFRLVIASCNGLVIFPVGHRELVVLNPSTREYKNLPPCPVEVLLEATSLNIGYDSSTDDYKILVLNKIGYASRRFEVWIFGFKSGRWRRIQNFPYAKYRVIGGTNFNEFKSSNCFVDGALHFLCRVGQRRAYKIVAFDVAEENFNVVPGPVINTVGSGGVLSQLQVIEGCLWLRLWHPNGEGVDIYVRKKHGVEFTWSLLCYIDKQYCDFMRSAQLLGYSKEGDNKILFQHKNNIYSYDLEERNLEKIEIMNIDDGISPISCIQSLVRINYPERPKEKEGLFSCIGSLFKLFFSSVT